MRKYWFAKDNSEKMYDSMGKPASAVFSAKNHIKHMDRGGEKYRFGVEHFGKTVYCLFIQYLREELVMKVEITIDRLKKLPDGAVPALEQELLRRLDQNFDNCSLVIRRAGTDGLTVLGGMDGDKKRIEEILQDTWESADDWFC